MKTSSSVLYPTDQVAERVTAYSENHTLPLPKKLFDYHEHIAANRSDSNYMISNFQAQANIWLAKLIGAKRVLEIGVYVGFSSMTWAHAVGSEGKVTGLEFSEDYAKLAKEAYAANGFNNIEVIVGDAAATLKELKPDEPFDLIFIDAQKSGYPGYLAAILDLSKAGASNRLLRPGGLIIADNVLRRGIVADDSDDNPWVQQEKGLRSTYWRPDDLVKLREFNDRLNEDPRLEAFLVPLWDGVGIGRLVD